MGAVEDWDYPTVTWQTLRSGRAGEATLVRTSTRTFVIILECAGTRFQNELYIRTSMKLRVSACHVVHAARPCTVAPVPLTLCR
jgi:hypothetical protein